MELAEKQAIDLPAEADNSLGVGNAEILLGACLIYAFISANILLSLLGAIVLYVLFKLLWRPLEPPILFFAMLFQWLQAFTKVVQANMTGETVEVYTGSPLAFKAILYAQLGLLLLGGAISFSMGKRKLNRDTFEKEALQFYPYQLFLAYLIAFALNPVISQLARGGLAQIVLALANLKWMFFALLFFVVTLRKEGYNFLIAAFLIEFISGFAGFFSSFKEVVFVSAILFFTFNQKIDLRILLFLSPVVVVLGLVFVVWTGVKGEYRQFLSGGSIQQVVTVSKSEALNKLVMLVQEVKPEMLPEFAQRSLDRLAYTDMLMYTMEYIPEIRSHENGTIWLGAVQHVLMPRMFFPGKPIIDDSEMARRLTGRDISGAERGTSISLGYFAESYADFGFPLMFLPLILLGVVIGFLYKKLMQQGDRSILYNYGLVIILFSGFKLFERVANKHTGIIILSAVVIFFIVIPYIIPFVDGRIKYNLNEDSSDNSIL